VVLDHGRTLRDLRCAWDAGYAHTRVETWTPEARSHYCASQGGRLPSNLRSRGRSFAFRRPPTEHLDGGSTGGPSDPPSEAPSTSPRAEAGRGQAGSPRPAGAGASVPSGEGAARASERPKAVDGESRSPRAMESGAALDSARGPGKPQLSAPWALPGWPVSPPTASHGPVSSAPRAPALGAQPGPATVRPSALPAVLARAIPEPRHPFRRGPAPKAHKRRMRPDPYFTPRSN
jgi:hypothetical protein